MKAITVLFIFILFHTLSSPVRAEGEVPAGDGPEPTARYSHPAQDRDGQSEDIYTCPMHPSVRQKGPGKCPICGMDLTKTDRGSPSADTAGTPVIYVSPAKQQLIGVKYDTARYRSLRNVIRAVGRVDFDERKLAVVNLRYSGWIEELVADYRGKYVREGDVLFTIYSPDAVAAQREYVLSRSLADDSTWTVDDLLGSNDLRATTREKLALLNIPESRIGQLENGLAVPRTVEVLSPISGFIIEKNATAGMYVEPGVTLYRIADLSTVWMQADIYQSDLEAVRVGQYADVTFAQLPDTIFRGSVSFVYPYLESATRSVKVRIEIHNARGTLKPDMYGNVAIISDSNSVLSVPIDAVMRTGKRQLVFVGSGGGNIEPREVRVGRSDATHYEILSGLNEGERVISSANFLIDAESRIQGVIEEMRRDENGADPGHNRQPR